MIRITALDSLLSLHSDPRRTSCSKQLCSCSPWGAVPPRRHHCIGVEFSVSANTQVAQLGVIDANNDGVLANNTIVGLYSTTAGNTSKSATYITSGTVLAGSAPTSFGVRNAFFVGITPIILTLGLYFIGSASGTGNGASGEGFGGSAAETFLANTAYVNGWFTGANTTFQGVGVNIQLTNQSSQGGKWPTALFDTTPVSSPVPEPASLSLAGLALGSILALRRKLA